MQEHCFNPASICSTMAQIIISNHRDKITDKLLQLRLQLKKYVFQDAPNFNGTNFTL